MGKLTSDIFNESCCDGGATSGYESAQPCGCDPGINYISPNCHIHKVATMDMIIESSHPQEYFNDINMEPIVEGKPFKEVIITDAKTGGQKGSKMARFDLIPPEATWALAEVYGAGTKKYNDRNWEKGYKWGLSVAALERHLNLWKQRKSWDTEGEGATGCHHLMQVAWHAFTLFIFELRGIGTDDRA